MHMQYIKSEPHPVRRLLSEAEKAIALAAMPVEKRRSARLMSFCECREPVVVDKLNRFRHVR